MKKKFLIPNLLIKILITGISVFAISKFSSQYNLKIYIFMAILLIATEIIFQTLDRKKNA
ncbi:hypothetical protein [Clostridium tagluense]|uniref:hypothetical protein n=1 Tax=Clostridium tagluense TaxID=360422 RepID=UPI001C6DEC58|nr:hypothetical protein [Clostridium tagluense]MBW9159205.1 hypothetical protein [Clostridium tagluense]WLC68201.1 hypothetical protein KTC93_23875 [Clostridium tagluense]